MKRSLLVLALASALPLASAQAPPADLVGIYTSETFIDLTDPAKRYITNEIAVYENPEESGSLRAFVRSINTQAYSCRIEGDVSNVDRSGFTVSETLLGRTCTLRIVRSGDSLRIGKATDFCEGFCGLGGSFGTTPYKKLCGVVDEDVLYDMTTRTLPFKPDYGPTCSKPKN